ncbi:MAG: DUF4982 domain-containing protein [Bacteroidales bacterium]|nr:DUF4982 domain-containing protein [Candidatus Sodaliphilus aphodohippi]
MKSGRALILIWLATASLAASAIDLRLDGTKWQFSMIDRSTAVATAKTDNGSAQFGLGNGCDISEVKATFDGDKVQWAYLKLEVSNDGTNWTTMQKPDREMKCQVNLVNDISSIGSTVGLTKVTGSTSVTVPVNGKWRFVKLHISECQDNDRHKIDNHQATIEVMPRVDYTLMPDMALMDYDDSNWQTVGVPHCFNEHDSFLNGTTGERCHRGEVWYRKHLKIDKKYRGKRVFIEFQSVNIGTTVYFNGHAIEGITQVKQPGTVTHVGSFLPFTVDVTPYVKYGEDNLLAVNVSNKKGTFFEWPNFGENEGFGQAMGGIVAPVVMHIKGDVYIPENHYSPTSQWGTYYGTVSADSHRAVLRFVTRVENTRDKQASITLRTRLLDANGKTVLQTEQRQVAPAGKGCTFDRTQTLNNPILWYPVGGKGTPYLYTVSEQVLVDGKVTDTREEPFGIRTITWDNDHCFVNGDLCLLRGFGNRNIYPALGSAVPASFQWEEIKRIADCGGNVLRVGHQPPFVETIKACDALGVMLFLDSGDGEWSLKDEPANTYKYEYDRDAVIAFRNHPSILVWESNNGLAHDGKKYLPSRTQEQVDRWDYINPRIVMNRDGYPPEWDKNRQILIGYTNWYWKENEHPSINTEVYGANWSGNPCWCIARHDYDNEKKFASFYVQDYLNNLRDRACGWINWMLAETYGEGYTIYLNGMRNQKSLGSCAMDGNRFPKLTYRIYRDALWVPFSTRPGVTLQSHWNLSGIQDVDAWSNCPQVELYINNVSQGTIKPDSLTRRCTWKGITWQPGTVRAVGRDNNGNEVCSDFIETAGAPHHIELTVDTPSAKPDGSRFTLCANGSDAFTVKARIVDQQGRWCPLADNILTFEVEGEGVYKGSYNFYVTPDKGLSYHAPGDHELQAEGGLMRAAVRTTFKPGKITVRVSSPGLIGGECSTYSINLNKQNHL